jgi:hypothetical protein
MQNNNLLRSMFFKSDILVDNLCICSIIYLVSGIGIWHGNLEIVLFPIWNSISFGTCILKWLLDA